MSLYNLTNIMAETANNISYFCSCRRHIERNQQVFIIIKWILNTFSSEKLKIYNYKPNIVLFH